MTMYTINRDVSIISSFNSLVDHSKIPKEEEPFTFFLFNISPMSNGFYLHSIQGKFHIEAEEIHITYSKDNKNMSIRCTNYPLFVWDNGELFDVKLAKETIVKIDRGEECLEYFDPIQCKYTLEEWCVRLKQVLENLEMENVFILKSVN